jgi:hypothetical protein
MFGAMIVLLQRESTAWPHDNALNLVAFPWSML